MIIIRLGCVCLVVLAYAVWICWLWPDNSASHHLGGDRIKTACRNLIGRSLACADNGKRTACGWVIERWKLAGKKASLPHQIGRHGEVVRDAVIQQQRLIVHEEECLIPYNRASQGTTKLIGTVWSFVFCLP